MFRFHDLILKWWKQNRHNRRHVRNGDEPQADDYEPAPSIIRPNTNTEEAEYKKYDREYKDRQILANYLIVLFTAITAGVAIWQGFLTRRALQNAQESSRDATDQLWRAISNLNWQAKSMDKSAKEVQAAIEIANKNFRQDERPYIFVEDVKGQPLRFSIGEAVSWNVEFLNYGKSPSVRERTEASVWLGPTAVQNVDNFFRKLPATFESGEFQTPPNANATDRTSSGFNYTTIKSKRVITQPDVDYLRSHDVGAVLAGRTWYFDLFGDPHYTDFCRYTLRTGAVSYCQRHNEIH